MSRRVRQFRSCLVAIALLATATPCLAAPTPDEIKEVEERITRILTENIMPFWIERMIDNANGGYHLNHDVDGIDQGPASKGIVSQARCLWYASHLINQGFGDEALRRAADHGFAFITERLRDPVHGGYYQQLAADGEAIERGAKHLYGQSFVLYALSEYALATGSPEAKRHARDLISALDYHAYDDEHGGYIESFTRDWKTPEPDAPSLMSAPHDMKLMNTHLHLMEAFTTYCRAVLDPLAEARLSELIAIQSNSVVRKSIGACSDKYAIDWTPLDRPEYNIVSYGHDIENVWLLIDALDALDRPTAPYHDLFHTLMNYSLKHGYDHENGGFYDYGPFGKDATSLKKVWWVQSEGIVAALEMYALSGEDRYWDVFMQMLDWIESSQVDWEHGDWFSSIDENGEVSGGKASLWKTPYHNGRAMARCLQTLQIINESSK